MPNMYLPLFAAKIRLRFSEYTPGSDYVVLHSSYFFINYFQLICIINDMRRQKLKDSE